MSSLSLRRLKLSSESQAATADKQQLLKKQALFLIHHHLQTHGYHASAQHIQKEASLSDKDVIADNIDLIMVIEEFQEYYQSKFGKMPKIFRKADAGEVTRYNGPPILPRILSNVSSNKEPTSLSGESTREPPRRTQEPVTETKAANNPHHADQKKSIEREPKKAAPHVFSPIVENDLDNLVAGTKIKNKGDHVSSVAKKALAEQPIVPDEYDNQLLRPLPYMDNETAELARIIQRDIFVNNPNVRWSDVAGQADSKRILREAVIWPIRYPSLFTGLLSPWKGVLLFGPPGTGKTMLAKAVATECKTTFFNISASSIVSKWRGDSEKLVRVLFELARHHAPSTIFLDELDSIMSTRSSEGEHEGSRRMKTELLIQMDGLAQTKDHVFLLAASNLPWQLDQAMLRRLEKRILINLPDDAARCALFTLQLSATLLDSEGARVVGEIDYKEASTLTDGYSGADIQLVCKEAAMRPLRRIFDKLEALNISRDENVLSDKVTRDPIEMSDVYAAIKATRPSCDRSMEVKYAEWQQDFGSV